MRAFATLLILPGLALADGISWWTDYNAARSEAEKTRKPMCMVVGSDQCFYCRKLESTTLADPAISEILKQRFITIKLDGNKEIEITRALGVQVYPTTVLATAEGSILAFLRGYVATEAFQNHLSRTLARIEEDEKLERLLLEAESALQAKNLNRAAVLLHSCIAGGPGKPVAKKAQKLLDELAPALREQVSVQTADAETLMILARRFYANKNYAIALELAREVVRTAPGSASAETAGKLIEEIESDALKFEAACEDAAAVAAQLYLSLSEQYLRKENFTAARHCLEQALRISPDGPHAEKVQLHLTKLKGQLQAVPATLKK